GHRAGAGPGRHGRMAGQGSGSLHAAGDHGPARAAGDLRELLPGVAGDGGRRARDGPPGGFYVPRRAGPGRDARGPIRVPVGGAAGVCVRVPGHARAAARRGGGRHAARAAEGRGRVSGGPGPTAYDVAEHYDDAYYADLADRYARRSRFARQRVANVPSLLPPLEGRRVVDIGCGMGTFAIECARRGAVALGVDPAPAALPAARRVAKAEGVRGASFVRADGVRL